MHLRCIVGSGSATRGTYLFSLQGHRCTILLDAEQPQPEAQAEPADAASAGENFSEKCNDVIFVATSLQLDPSSTTLHQYWSWLLYQLALLLPGEALNGYYISNDTSIIHL